jgi:hypothetical protein
MKKAEQAKLKRELIALKTRGDPDLDQIAMATRAQMIRRDRVAAKKLEPLLAKTFDVEKIDRVMAQRQPERTNIGKKRPAEIGKAQAALEQGFRRGVENRRMALEVLATPGLPPTSTYIALDPFMIWARPSNFLMDSSIPPKKSYANISWAKIYFDTSSGSGRNEVTFYYVWENPSAYYAVVNAVAALMLTGYCKVTALSGVFSGGDSSITAKAALQPLEWWNQPPTPATYPQASSSRVIVEIEAHAGGFFSYSTEDDEHVARGIDLRYDLFSTPPGGVAVFEVALIVDYAVDDGWLQVDFGGPRASSSSYSIRCPSLQLELITAPPLGFGAPPMNA